MKHETEVSKNAGEVRDRRLHHARLRVRVEILRRTANRPFPNFEQNPSPDDGQGGPK
jgi:hypothetical protein